MARNLFAKPGGRNLFEKPDEEAQETAPAGQPVPQDDPYFLPVEEGQTVAVPDAPGGKKDISEFTAGEQALGAIESGLTAATGGTTGMVSGAAGGFVGMLGDLANILTPEEAQELQQRWAAYGTYEPKTEAGRRIIEEAGELTESLPPITGAATPRVRIGKEARARVLPEQVRRAEAFAEQTGAPLMATDIDQPTTFAGKAFQSGGEKIPVIGTGGRRARQQEARQKAVTEFISDYEDVTDRDLYDALVRSNSKRDKNIANQYNEIGSQMGNDVVSPNKTVDVIDAELGRLKTKGRLQDSETIGKLEEIKEEILAGDVDYQVMRENRTGIRERLKKDGEGKKQPDRVIDRVYNAMTEDIQSAVEKKLGTEALNKLKAIDRATFDKFNETKKTKLKNVLNKGAVKPEEATKMLLANDRSEINQLYKALDKKGKETAKAIIVRKVREDLDGSDSPDMFLQKVKGLKKQFGTFFRGSEREDFDNLISYLKQTKQASKAGTYNLNGNALLGALSAAPAIDIYGGGSGAATASALTLGVASQLFESKRIRSTLRRLKGARPYTPEYNQILISLDNAVNEITGEQNRQEEISR